MRIITSKQKLQLLAKAEELQNVNLKIKKLQEIELSIHYQNDVLEQIFVKDEKRRLHADQYLILEEIKEL